MDKEQAFIEFNNIHGDFYHACEECDTTEAVFDSGYAYANRWNVIERDDLPTEHGEYVVATDYQYNCVDYFDGTWNVNGVIAWREIPQFEGE